MGRIYVHIMPPPPPTSPISSVTYDLQHVPSLKLSDRIIMEHPTYKRTRYNAQTGANNIQSYFN